MTCKSDAILPSQPATPTHGAWHWISGLARVFWPGDKRNATCVLLEDLDANLLDDIGMSKSDVEHNRKRGFEPMIKQQAWNDPLSAEMRRWW